MFDKPERGGVTGKFFKPKEWKDAAAMLIEPTSYRADVEGKYGKRDILTVEMTVFSEDGSHKTLETQAITNNPLINDLKGGVGGRKYLQKLGQTTTKKGHEIWVWEDVTDEKVVKAAEAYVTQRDSDLDDAPDI